MRGADLRQFGAFAFGFRDVSRVAAAMISSLRDGGDALARLADAWDDEQRARGLARKTRVLRRRTLRSFVAFVAANRRTFAVPHGVSLATLAVDAPHGASLRERVESAIVRALATGNDRDAALLSLVWESGWTLERSRAMRVRDLWVGDRVPWSARCGAALARLAGDRPPDAWIFRGRDHSRPLGDAAAREIVSRLGATTSSLLVARSQRLRVLGASDDTDAATLLAGERV